MIILGFSLPISISISIIISALIFLLWLFEGNFFNKYKIITNNHIIYTFMAFFFVQIIGLLWTENIKWGLHIVGKEWRMLLPIVLITIVKKEHIKYYIYSFILAMSISEILSYGIWFEILPPFLHGTVYDPTPFMHHTSYNPLLAFSIYILAYFILFQNKNYNIYLKIFSILFLFTMSINMFITGGRAGQAGYFVMLALIVLLYFKKNTIKSFLIVAILIPIVFIIAYNSSKIFNNRINLIQTNIATYNQNKNTSVGLRIAFLINSLEIIKKHPIFGVGTGDFPVEYEKINKINTPNLIVPTQPHNMYILQLVQTGIFGLIAMLSIFFVQIKIALKGGKYTPLKFGLPVFFLVIMFSDSYLLGHYTSLLFVYFSSFLYKDYNSENT
jgi:O-antigen ligase